MPHLFVDLWIWGDFFAKSIGGLIPYVDFPKEYPVGAGIIYWFMAQMFPVRSMSSLLIVHSIIMAIVDILNAGIFYGIAYQLNEKRAWFLTLVFLLTPTSILLTPVRFESFVITTALLGYWFHINKKPLWATAVWSLGCSIKWYPIFFIAIQELQTLVKKESCTQWLKSAAIFVGVIGALNLPFILMGYAKNGSADNWLATYLFHVQRPLFWDTVLGVIHLWWGVFEWEKYASLWSAGLMLFFLFFRPLQKFETKAILILVGALIFNRIYSTQFHLWFTPLWLFLMAQEKSEKQFKNLLFLYIFLDVVNVLVYPFAFAAAYSEMGVFQPGLAATRGAKGTLFFSAMILLRAFALIEVIWLFSRKRYGT